jgi:hypothetical protein
MKVSGKMINFLIIVTGGLLSISITYAVTWLSSYEIGDVSGIIYLVAIAPTVGVIVGLMLVLWRPFITKPLGILGAVFLLIALSVFHWLALQEGWIGGWYKLSTQEISSDLSDSELRSLLSKKNENLRESAWDEFANRSLDRPQLLIGYMEALRRDSPRTYVDDERTHRAVTLLAEQRAPQAVPYLREMLTSNQATILTRGQSKILKFNSRALAKRLLEEHYGILSDVPVEQALDARGGSTAN